MKTLESIVGRLAEEKAKLRQLRKQAKEAMSASDAWEDMNEQYARLRFSKKTLEFTLVGETLSDQIDSASLKVRQTQQMLSDIALTALMKGDQVEVKTANFRYEPQIKVTYRQMRLLV